MRAGIQSVARGQVWSGYALGMNYWQTMGNIVLPQAFRNMIPVLLTQTIVLFQDVSLVYVLSITDFVGAASKIAQRDGRLVEMYTFVAVVYFVDLPVAVVPGEVPATSGSRSFGERIARRAARRLRSAERGPGLGREREHEVPALAGMTGSGRGECRSERGCAWR